MTHRDQIELVLTDASVLAQVLGRELTASERTQIERGHAVVFDPEYFSADGTVTLYEVEQYEQGRRPTTVGNKHTVSGAQPSSAIR